MNFTDAQDEALSGYFIRRTAWPKGRMVFYVKPFKYGEMEIRHSCLDEIMEADGKEPTITIGLCIRDRHSIRAGWNPKFEDYRANDWHCCDVFGNKTR